MTHEVTGQLASDGQQGDDLSRLPQPLPDTTPTKIEQTVGENMGCYYRVKTHQWLKEINNPHTKEYSHLIDLTLETKTVTKYINEAVISELEKMKTEWGYGEYPVDNPRYGMDWEDWIDYRIKELRGKQ